MIAAETLDAAMLDVNIMGGTSLSVALALRERGVPILFATGYGSRPEGWPDGPVVDKPYSSRQISDALTIAMSTSASADDRPNSGKGPGR